jgi:hypothetical protein
MLEVLNPATEEEVEKLEPATGEDADALDNSTEIKNVYISTEED